MTAYERAVRDNPTAYNLFLLGVCYHNVEKHEPAVQTLTRAISLLNAAKPSWWVYEGRPRECHGQYYSSPPTIPLTSKELDAWWYRADSKRMLQDYRGAIQDFTVVLKRDSLDHAAFYYRAASKYQLENTAGAYEDVRRAIALEKTKL